jgi:hypothetical protein
VENAWKVRDRCLPHNAGQVHPARSQAGGAQAEPHHRPALQGGWRPIQIEAGHVAKREGGCGQAVGVMVVASGVLMMLAVRMNVRDSIPPPNL